MDNKNIKKGKISATADKTSTRKTPVVNPNFSSAVAYTKHYGGNGKASGASRSARSTETFLQSLMDEGRTQSNPDGSMHAFKTFAIYMADHAAFFSEKNFEDNLEILTDFLTITHQESVVTWKKKAVLAVENEDITIIHYLKDVCGFNINSEITPIKIDPKAGEPDPLEVHTPLSLACWQGRTEFVKRLLRAGANSNEMTSSGFSAIHFASMEMTNLPALKVLLENTKCVANVNICDDKKAKTALMQASHYGLYKTVKYLLEQNAEVNQQDSKGKSALFYAVMGGHFNVIKLLVAHNACVNLRDRDNAGILHYLIIYHANQHDKNDLEENSKLMEILHYLVDFRGVDFNTQKIYSTTPLHEACRLGLVQVVKYLLERGASTKVKKNGWQTPIWSVVNSHKPSIQTLILLFEYRADFTVKNSFGNTLKEFAKEVKNEILLNALERLEKLEKTRRIHQMNAERRQILGCLVQNPAPKPVAGRKRTANRMVKIKQEPVDVPTPYNGVQGDLFAIPGTSRSCRSVNNNTRRQDVVPGIKQEPLDKKSIAIKQEPVDDGYEFEGAQPTHFVAASAVVKKEVVKKEDVEENSTERRWLQRCPKFSGEGEQPKKNRRLK